MGRPARSPASFCSGLRRRAGRSTATCPASKLFGVLVLLPWFLPNVVAGHMWALMLDPRLGVINDLLVEIGILDSYKAWFADPDTALAAAIVVEIWHGFPFFTLLLLAGLKGIPRISTRPRPATAPAPFAQFRLVTLPMLKTIIVAAVILRVISLVNSPDILLILTGGGPGARRRCCRSMRSRRPTGTSTSATRARSRS